MVQAEFALGSLRFGPAHSGAQTYILQVLRQPAGVRLVEYAADIDIRRRDILLGQRQKNPDLVGEPQMRICQHLQLLPVVFRRLMIARLAHFDRYQVVGDFALVHDDIGIDRFSKLIVSGDNRSMRQPQPSLAEPVVVAIDLPARKLLFELHRQPMGQRALDMLKIDRPTLDWVALAKGMGVPARAVTSADELVKALAEAMPEKGPRLIEVQM